MARKIYGMTMRQWKKLGKLLNPPTAEHVTTVKEVMVMLELKVMKDFDKAEYEGFILQKGFYYGRNLRGQAIATSGWVNDGCVYLYTRTEEGWGAQWTDIDLFDVNFEE